MIEVTNGVVKVEIPKRDLDNFSKLGYKEVAKPKPKMKTKEVNGKDKPKSNTKQG